MGFVFFLLISSAMSIKLFGVIPPFDGLPETSTFLWRPQVQMFGVQWHRFGKNYSLVYPLTINGCNSSDFPPLDSTKVMIFRWRPHPCSYGQMASEIASRGGAGALAVTPLPEIQVGNWFQDVPYNGIPVIFAENAFSSGPISDIVPISIVAQVLLQKGLNLTMEMTFPTTSPLQVDLMNISGPANVSRWIAISISILCILIAGFKLGIFVTLQGVRINLPQIVFVCSVSGMIFNLMIAFNAAGPSIEQMITGPQVFFEVFNWGFVIMTGCFVGFYFKEVTLLTSSQQGGFLEKLRYPAIVVIAGVWIMIIVTGALGAAENPGFLSSSGGSTAQFAILTIGVIVMDIILLWGAISVQISMRNSSQNLQRMLLLVYLAVILATAFGIWFFAFRYLTEQAATWCSVLNVVRLTIACNLVTPPVVMILFCLCFQVTISKEIEVSASGTSSTSKSSKSSSSGSSSSGSDPVIEL
jgi:hypothetical protein